MERFRLIGRSNTLRAGLAVALFILLAAGCGRSTEPVSPGATPLSTDRAAAASRVLWGTWHVSIDPETLTAEVTPERSADFTCNVTMFMQPPSSPTHMVSIAVGPGSDPSTGFFVVDVTLRHPFPGLAKYRGFDVRGILLADGSINGRHDSTVVRAGPSNTHLLNPDGYTRWWNYREFSSYETVFGFNYGKLAPRNHPTATVNGYKYFADELGLDEPVSALDPDSRGTFSTVPGVNERRYEIQFRMSGPGVVYDFQYAVDASWSEPDPAYAPTYPEEAFNLMANCQEPFMTVVEDNGSTAWYVDPANNGGEIKLAIEVFDHQAVGNPNGVAGEIGSVVLEGDVLPSAIDILPTATVSAGSGMQSSIYEVTLSSLNLTRSGLTELFGTIESANVTTYEPQVPGGSGFEYPPGVLSAYFTCRVEISDTAPSEPMVTGIDPAWGVKGFVYENVIISGANFADGAIASLVQGATEIVANETSFIDSSTLNTTFDLNDAPAGPYDVIVENPGGASGQLDDGFEVKILNLIWDDDQVIHPTGGSVYWATSIDDREPRILETSDNQPFIGWGQWPTFSAFKGAAESSDDGQTWSANIWQPFACDRHCDTKIALDDSDPDGTGNIYMTAIHRWDDESICASKSSICRWPMTGSYWHTGEQVEGTTELEQEFIWTADGYPVHLRDPNGEIHCKVGTYQHSIQGNPSWPSGSWYGMPDPKIADGYLSENRSIARDAEGGIHLVFESDDHTRLFLISDTVGDGHNWGNPMLIYDAIEDGMGGCRTPALDIAEDGSFRVTFLRSNLIWDKHLCYTMSPTGEEGTWSDPELVASDVGGTGLMKRNALDSSMPYGIDVVGLSYTRLFDIYYAWKPARASNWLIVQVNTYDRECMEPDTIMTSNTTVHVAWSQYDDIEAHDIWHRRGTWSDE